ncbi:3-beta-hydroxy-Delta(5)-steroid dehydrogenase [Amylibacter marinus]|uniref:3-beta-hydroxy-Delta(5)-steroid dehydrogenase n=1 Tax=Amylibacter marinus TaxID=1475483 RepID=A0ABQ5VW09_9RHOB|nr:complex I NDUFA9 subunit family protein [Amylibacter marinus]GLQ35455.1 3-beta-hydroxy-Delta(5)-steroid dehydrogenase [Amylibacter marinus]
MSSTPKLVTIFGGSGFLGRYVAQRMAKEGWRVRVAVRRPNEALHVRPYGAVGQVEPILANIRDDASTLAAVTGADAVVNCVGSFDCFGKNNVDAVQVDGAQRIAKMAQQAGVGRLVHLSALGADVHSNSRFFQTKAAGEALVKAAFRSAVIMRPAVMFGNEDRFFNRPAFFAGLSPVLPIVGANSQQQPVYVDDVAAAIAQAVLGRASAGVYQLGGPDVASHRALMAQMLGVIRRRRLMIAVPNFAAKIKAVSFDLCQRLTGGLIKNKILSADQLRTLSLDCVVDSTAKSFADLGITPCAMDGILPEYLYRFRPYGQYSELTESAKDLKT